MATIIDFPKEETTNYRVLFNLPPDKVLKVNKGLEDNFDIEIKNNHGTAWLKANGKTKASNKVLKVFPTCEIIEVTVVQRD